MKVLKSKSTYSSRITAAENGGTTFYEISENALKSVYDEDSNTVLRYLVTVYGFDAFDVDKMWGSSLEGDTLYLCVTDGVDISVGDEYVDPESAIEEFGVDRLSSYVEQGTPDIIKRYISGYELRPIDIDEVGAGMISDGFSLTTTLQDMYKLDLIDPEEIF